MSNVLKFNYLGEPPCEKQSMYKGNAYDALFHMPTSKLEIHMYHPKRLTCLSKCKYNFHYWTLKLDFS